MTEPLEQATEADSERIARLVRRTLYAGWLCVALSALFLYVSGTVDVERGRSSDFLWATSLMLARLFGMGSFAIGGVAIYNHRWTEGVLIMLSSVVLPLIAFVLHGTI